ncbi:Uu.00g025810.m01.CDS01 [Anthostomella pinea]|uniref:Uu.00g025810.m01.CDS01 n=1 Tax=Anthostomella pinea TaxID=933095 RepID=A0AAI8YCN7_9PEZI|nr:Uu.00g025810.m01.CDS01 [Anthostomella pinea]
MDIKTVGDVVTALVGAYATALEYYTGWRQRKWQENRYTRATRGNVTNSGFCAASISLRVAAAKIREAFDGGVDILGNDFAIGDRACRETLQANFERLQERIDVLQSAVNADDAPLELAELIRVSEAVRIECLAALSKQYQRVAVGRLVPRELPGSRQRSWLDVSGIAETPATTPEEEETEKEDDDDDDDEDGNSDDDDDAQTVHRRASSSKSPYQSEPPSPPPTPKMIPDGHLQSTRTSTTSTSGLGPRGGPKNSIFSAFCPEAMKYQVNLQKSIPPKGRRCRCGYDWNGRQTQDRAALMVKEGFQITPRFLGKSHCEDGRFGCVVCTSTGKTKTYENVEDLRAHLDASHTKWQLLHDRDMAGHWET